MIPPIRIGSPIIDTLGWAMRLGYEARHGLKAQTISYDIIHGDR